MAVSFQTASWSSAGSFNRHIQRLAWYVLIGSLALLVPQVGALSYVGAGMTAGLGATVVVIAVLCVVRDIRRYVRQEAAHRREAIQASAQAGACRAAEAIQDRVGNLLSVTVGNVDFLTEDEHLSQLTREHAEQARDSALAAARAVSAFRQSLGCWSQVRPSSAPWETPRAVNSSDAERSDNAWLYDEISRTIRTGGGAVVARLNKFRDRSDEVRTGRLIARAPAVRDALGDAQQLAIALLADQSLTRRQHDRILEVLERINSVTDAVEL